MICVDMDMDMGMEISDNEPQFIRTGQRVHQDVSKQMWFSLIRSGRNRTDPWWGAAVAS